jgi:ABC-type transport system involved in cytochrome c biogenesis permease subunit
MSESPLNELDDVVRIAVERSRRTAVPERDLAATVERMAARTPLAAHRAGWREPLRRAVAAAIVLLAGALLVNQASAAWAEVAGAATLSMQVGAEAAPPPPVEGPPVRRPITGLLLAHVVSLLAGYAAYALAWLLSCAALVAMLFTDASRLLRATVRVSVVLLALGVLLMLTAVVLGAVWAKPNLGRYWGWDVKEVNGLATLLLGVVWLVLTWRWVRMTTHGALGRVEPGLLAAACFWAAMAGWWLIAFVGNAVLLWQTAVFICLCVLVNVAIIAGAWSRRRAAEYEPEA